MPSFAPPAAASAPASAGSPGLAAEAERRLGRPVRVMRFDELEAIEAYDAVWASACLLHAPRDELPGILAGIHRALKPSGVFYASFKAGDHDGRDSLGRYYNYTSRERLEAAYAESGRWQTIAIDSSEIKSFDDAPATMLHVLMRKD